MKKRIESLDEFIIENVINESREKIKYQGVAYTADFIKNKGFDGVSWHLVLKNSKTGEILAWPDVFHYQEGWTQGMGRSQRMWFLQTKHYGGVSQGSGRTSQSTPAFVDDQLEYAIKAYNGDHYSDDAIAWYQQNVHKFPKGTKKQEIAQALR